MSKTRQVWTANIRTLGIFERTGEGFAVVRSDDDEVKVLDPAAQRPKTQLGMIKVGISDFRKSQTVYIWNRAVFIK